MGFMDNDSSTFEFEDFATRKKLNKRRFIVISVLVLAVGIGIGVLIGYFSREVTDIESLGPCLGVGVPAKIIEDADPTITDKIIDRIKAENIRENLRSFTADPHLAATDGDNKLVQTLIDSWTQSGLENVHTLDYEVLLSYPDMDDPTLITLHNGAGDTLFTSQIKEKPVRPEQERDDIVPPFNAYAPPGDFEGDLVYVNYCEKEDFQFLNDTLDPPISVTDHIVICRYGRIFRGDKVKFATLYGARAVILYSDPADYADDTVTDDPYPDSWWLPPTGVQSGSIFGGDGDPLTRGIPALPSAYRFSPDEVPELPIIPSHPISYGDAYHLLKDMKGSTVPDEWQGKLNFTYRYGPGFATADWKVKMHVTSSYAVRNATNIVGFIYGSVEPDRYVMLGNHRDAWVFGAADPTSGTAVQAEVIRVMGELLQEGWRPRRTMMFCSWGAEEFGLIGSFEFVEHYLKNLRERSVLYINVDTPLSGNHSMSGAGVPLVFESMYEVAKKIRTPNSESETLYEEWTRTFPKLDESGTPTGFPRIGTLGSGSDYAPFLIIGGIPALDVSFRQDGRWNIASYPLYHSGYETFHLIENYIDREFKVSQAIARYCAEMSRYWSDSLVLPYSPELYAQTLQENIDDLLFGYGELFSQNNVSLEYLYEASAKMSQSISSFRSRIRNINSKNPIEVRQYNDQMMQMERAFLNDDGLPTNPLYKHLLFAPSSANSYAGSTFPGLVDLIADIQESEAPEFTWEDVKRHLSVIVITIQSAADALAPPTEF